MTEATAQVVYPFADIQANSLVLEWQRILAERGGIPPYVMKTDRKLLELVQSHPERVKTKDYSDIERAIADAFNFAGKPYLSLEEHLLKAFQSNQHDPFGYIAANTGIVSEDGTVAGLSAHCAVTLYRCLIEGKMPAPSLHVSQDVRSQVQGYISNYRPDPERMKVLFESFHRNQMFLRALTEVASTEDGLEKIRPYLEGLDETYIKSYLPDLGL